MFPFCLINASVADAEGITSRLVSFPLTLFSSVRHIAFPMVLFKKQTGSAFRVFPSARPSLFSVVVFGTCYKKLFFLTNQNSSSISRLQFEFMTHRFTFIELTCAEFAAG